MRFYVMAAVLIAGIFLSFDALSASGFMILAPDEGAVIGTGQVLLIGKIQGTSEGREVEISSDGDKVGNAPLGNGSFYYALSLSRGPHDITLKAAGVTLKTIRITVGKENTYRYHIEPDAKSCPDCHGRAAGNQFEVPSMQSRLCDECHDPQGSGDYVHGPVAAGSCTPCHDPHGSSHESFLVATGKDLCLMCHSQNLSRRHIEQRKNADCVKCHDPHSSAKMYHLR